MPVQCNWVMWMTPAAMISFVGYIASDVHAVMAIDTAAACDAQYVLEALHHAACHVWPYHFCQSSATFSYTHKMLCLLARHGSGNILYSTVPTGQSWVAQLDIIGDIGAAEEGS